MAEVPVFDLVSSATPMEMQKKTTNITTMRLTTSAAGIPTSETGKGAALLLRAGFARAAVLV